MKKSNAKYAGIWLIAISTVILTGSLSAQERQGTLSEEAKAKLVERTTFLLNESYVFPEVAEKIEIHLKAKQKEGAFDTITDKKIFASVMTKQEKRPLRLP